MWTPSISRRAALLGTAGLLAAPGLPLAQGTALDIYGAADPQARRGGTLTVAIANEPPNLDPFHQAGDARTAVTVLMYQGLMYEHPSGRRVRCWRRACRSRQTASPTHSACAATSPSTPASP